MPLFLLAGSPANREPCFVTGNDTPIFLMVAMLQLDSVLPSGDGDRIGMFVVNLCVTSYPPFMRGKAWFGHGLNGEESGRILLGWYHSRQETK
jgi:hypothetical protein